MISLHVGRVLVAAKSFADRDLDPRPGEPHGDLAVGDPGKTSGGQWRMVSHGKSVVPGPLAGRERSLLGAAWQLSGRWLRLDAC